jgi:hypothetical protein
MWRLSYYCGDARFLAVRNPGGEGTRPGLEPNLQQIAGL